MLLVPRDLVQADVPAPAAGGDAAGEAFAAALKALEGGLRRHLLGQLGSASAAEDALQETFLRMLRYREVREPGEIRALLYRVAASVVADRHRHARSQHADQHCAIEDEEIVSADPQPDRVLAGQQQLALIKRAIAALPPRCRQAFLLHRFDGLSYREIARRTGTSERTVENQIAHALAVCRRVVGEQRGRTFK
jgi:RNA polymerase sigma-70 factor (ECF subfamily)